MSSSLAEPRRYQDEHDLGQMLTLLQAGRAAANGSYYVHTGDLKWWLYYPPLGSSWWDTIYLWQDPADKERLLGWALLDPAGETFDVYFQPELANSTHAAEMLAWAEAALEKLARAAGRDQVGICWVVPEDRFRVSWLEERGFQVAAQSPALACPLDKPVADFSIPEGYQVRPCRGLAEVAARAKAQYGAFESTAPFDQYVDRFAKFMQSPVYAPDADLIVAAADGRIAAFCITWADRVNQVGLFEPVGTHPEFQRLGLGRAVMLAGLRRLQAMGMQRAILSTGSDNTAALHLYASVGFEQYSVFRYYTKKLK